MTPRNPETPMPHYDNWKNNDYQNLKALTESSFFRNCLLPDIRAGIVFPAFRKGKVDFYYLGQKLCSYYSRNGFRSNIAYLAAFNNRPRGEVSEANLAKLTVCKSFQDGYSQIKANITLYREPESRQTFKLCSKFSVARDGGAAAKIVVLDAEVQRHHEGKNKRIDLLLYNVTLRTMRFIEIKTFASPYIWSRGNDNPVVASQVRSYEGLVIIRQRELLADYQQYTQLINRLVGLGDNGLPHPDHLDCRVDLLIVDYQAQQQRILNQQVFTPLTKSFRVHAIGNTANTTPETLQKWWNTRQ